MVALPAAVIIASAIASAAQAGGSAIGNRRAKKTARKQYKEQEKAEHRRAKESKYETRAGLYEDSMRRALQEEASKSDASTRHTKNKMTSMQNTASLIRNAFNI